MKECGAYLQYKKKPRQGQKRDAAIPKGVEERRDHCIAWMERPSPVGSSCNSDNKGDSNDKGVDTLLSLAAARAGVEENQGKLEDLERFGILDEYGEIDKDMSLTIKGMIFWVDQQYIP